MVATATPPAALSSSRRVVCLSMRGLLPTRLAALRRALTQSTREASAAQHHVGAGRHGLRIGPEHDPVRTLRDVPVEGLAVETREQPRVGGDGDAATLAGLQLHAVEAKQPLS